MPDTKVTVLAHFRAKEGMEESLKEVLMSLIAPTREEEGCINYDLHQSPDNKALFMFYENWVSKEHLDHHLQTPHVGSVAARANDLLAEPFEITFWQMIS